MHNSRLGSHHLCLHSDACRKQTSNLHYSNVQFDYFSPSIFTFRILSCYSLCLFSNEIVCCVSEILWNSQSLHKIANPRSSDSVSSNKTFPFLPLPHLAPPRAVHSVGFYL